jgi:hypothetical protein
MFMNFSLFHLADRPAASENPLYRDRPRGHGAQKSFSRGALQSWTKQSQKGGQFKARHGGLSM